MKNKKLSSFTLNQRTIEMLDDYSKIKSINKSALIDKLICDEILKEMSVYQWSFENDPSIPSGVSDFFKKYIKINEVSIR